MTKSQIQVEIDPAASAAYITLSTNPVARTQEVTEAVMVDLDDHGVAVGIEVLDLGAKMPYEQLCTYYHVHSDVVDILKTIRPSIKVWSVSITSGPDGTSVPAAKQNLITA